MTRGDQDAQLCFLRNIIFRSVDDFLHHPKEVGGDRAHLRKQGQMLPCRWHACCTSGTEEFASYRVEIGMTTGLGSGVSWHLESMSDEKSSTLTSLFKLPPTAWRAKSGDRSSKNALYGRCLQCTSGAWHF